MCKRPVMLVHGPPLAIPPANFQAIDVFRAARKVFHKTCLQLNDSTITALLYRVSPLEKDHVLIFKNHILNFSGSSLHAVLFFF